MRRAAIDALARSGSRDAVEPLLAATKDPGSDGALRRAARGAVHEIQQRLDGAEKGQLSVSDEHATRGNLSFADSADRGQLALPSERERQTED